MKNKSTKQTTGALTIQEILSIGRGIYCASSGTEAGYLVFFKDGGLYTEDGELLQLSADIMSIEWQQIEDVDLLMLFKHRITAEVNSITNSMYNMGNQSVYSASIVSSLESIARTLSMFNSGVIVSCEK